MNKRKQGIAYFIVVTMILTALGQVTGVFREILFSAVFGTSHEFDAYSVVFGLVLFLGSLLSILPSLAIPALTHLQRHGSSEAFSERFTSLCLVSGSFVCPIVVFGLIFPDLMLKVIAPGLLDRTDSAILMHDLLLLTLPICFLMAMVHLSRGLLNMANRFSLSAMESLFFNVGVISATAGGVFLFDVKNVMLPIFGCYVAYLAYILICVKRIRRDYSLALRFDVNDFTQTVGSSAYLLLATLLAYVSPMIITWYATFSNEGVVSSLGYASRLILFGVGTIVNSMMSVFLPIASLAVTDGNLYKLSQQTEKLMSICLIVSSAAATVILLEGDYIISLLFQRGAFDSQSVRLVFDALLGYLPWIMFFPLSAIAVRILYANCDYRVIFQISLACLLIPLILAPILGRSWQGFGFALAASIHMVCYSILLLGVVIVKYAKLDLKMIVSAWLPTVETSSLVGIIYWVVSSEIPAQPQYGFLLLLVVLGAIAARGISSIVPFWQLLKGSSLIQTNTEVTNERRELL